MKLDIEYVEKLAKVLTDNSLTEISIENEEQSITLRKDVMAPIAMPAPSTPIQVGQLSGEPVKKGRPLTSPMVGTFYTAPAPDAEPFVKVGQTVKEGDVISIDVGATYAGMVGDGAWTYPVGKISSEVL